MKTKTNLKAGKDMKFEDMNAEQQKAVINWVFDGGDFDWPQV
jgi:hypothetical protein